MDKNRIAQAHNPLGPTLMFRKLTGREQVSGLFDFQLELLADKDNSVLPSNLIGKDITIELELQGGGTRFLNGQVTRFAFVGKEVAADSDLWRYEARMRPWLWYLTRASDFRIFQNKKVPDILDEIFANYPFPVEKRLQGTYKDWEYCVQYHETDFNFVSRLMEHEGIYYYFEHAMGRHTLVLADAIGAHSPYPGYATIPYIPHDRVATADEESIDGWQIAQEVEPGAYRTDDYYFETPTADLKQVRKKEFPHPNGGYEIYEWPGDYRVADEGENYTRVHLDELQAPHEIVGGQCNVRGVAPGYLFTLKKCPRRDQNREYLILAASYYVRDNPYHSGGEGEGAEWRMSLTAQPSSIAFRAPRITPKSLTHGPQTAVVVGPAGEEIWCDKYGRVKVQFHWDRYGKYDDNSSCWIRVSHPWAGSNWGGMFMPRIGQEVIVDFIGGDPDCPIITGRVYNADHMPPYELPKYQTYSSLKSHSTPKGSSTDWNELRFVDYKGKEQVFIHANWRMDVRVKWNKYETVRESSHYQIGKSCLFTVGGEYDLYVHGDIYAKGKSSAYIATVSDLHVKVGAGSMHFVTAGKEVNARSITIEAAKSVVLKCAGSFVEISPMGVTIQGPLVRINSGGAATGTGPMKMGDPLHAAGADTGEPGYLDRPYKGGGGGSRWHTENGYHSRNVTYDPKDGSFTYGGSGIKVTGSPDFCDKTLQTLGGIDSTPTGKKLVDNLQSNGKTATIREATPAESRRSGGGECSADSWNAMPAGTYTDSNGNPVTSDGTGSNSTVAWQPGKNAQYNVKDPATGATTTATQPDEALLGHELNHADHNGRGNNQSQTPDPKDSTGDQEESQTIGINDHKGKDVTENNLLKDLGENWQRTDHDSNAVPLGK